MWCRHEDHTSRKRMTWAAATICFALVAFGWHGSCSSAADGVIRLEIDARDAPRRMFHTRMWLPVEPGPLRLIFPKWIQAEHAPIGPIADLAGLAIRSEGRALRWQRDPLDMYAFEVDIPAGVREVEIEHDRISPARKGEALATANMAIVLWHEHLLYPAGVSFRDLEYQAELLLPDGWQDGSALKQASRSGNRVVFEPVTLEQLTDSPLFCGRYHKVYPLAEDERKSHRIFAVAESPGELEMSDAYRAGYDRLIGEAKGLFGAQPYDDYTFLVALSDNIAHTGLEHHQSSDNRIRGRAFADDQLHLATVRLLPHEYVHSWNGKYRRPERMVRPNLHEPLETDLLWIYEGLTRYLDRVLTARCGLYTLDHARQTWASGAHTMTTKRGRQWRPLVDTATAAQILYSARAGGSTWRRRVDFYNEGAFIWLEVDAIIRERSGGRRSLDDFISRFFGRQDGLAEPPVDPYELDDVVAALDRVESYDWRGLLLRRVETVGERPPSDGLERTGWRLGYGEEPTEVEIAREASGGVTDFSASIGLWLLKDAGIGDVVTGSPAARAGIAPGMKLVAVNGRRYTKDVLRTAIKQSKAADSRLDLLVENHEFFETCEVDYHDGARHYRLVPLPGRHDVLSEILAARTER